MSQLDEVLAESRRRVAEEKVKKAEAEALAVSSADTSMGHQFGQGFKETASLGYAPGAPIPPEGLPMSGWIAREGGKAAGFIPAAVAFSSGLGQIGVTGLAAEAAAGFLYGGLEATQTDPEAPPDANTFSSQVEERVMNGLKTAALFGAGHVVLRKLFGKSAGKMASEKAKLAEKEALLAADKAIPMPDIKPAKPPGFQGHPGAPSEDTMASEIAKTTHPGVPTEDALQAATPAELQKWKDYQSLKRRATGVPDNFQAPGPGGKLEDLIAAKKTAAAAPVEEDVTATITHSNMPADGETTPLSALIQPKLQKTTITAPAETIEKATQAGAWDRTVNPWAKDLLKPMGEQMNMFFEKALPEAAVDLEAGMKQMARDSGLKNLGEAPSPLKKIELPPDKLATQVAMQETVDDLVKKYGVTSELLQAASQTKEPINMIMAHGIPYEAAEKMASTLAERAKTELDIKDIANVTFAGGDKPKKTPSWSQASKRVFTPDQVFDLFHNVPFKSSQAFVRGLVERELKSSGDEPLLKLTEKGYGFLARYNPEALTGAEPSFISKKALGAIRARGKSLYSFTADELKKDVGLKVPTKVALEKGWIRPKLSEGEAVPGQFELTENGAGFVSGARGHNANVELQAWNKQAGNRLDRTDLAGIEALKVKNVEEEIRFKDLWDQIADWRKGCTE